MCDDLGGGQVAAISVCVSILVIAASLIGTSIQQLSSEEYGLMYDVNARELESEVREGGLHNGPPGFRFVKFPSTYISTDIPEEETSDEDAAENERNGVCVSRDGLRVKIAVSYQYQIEKDSLVTVVKKYRTRSRWSDLINAAAVSATQTGCSLYNISSFQTQRAQIQSSMFDELKKMLEGNSSANSEGLYARAIELQLREVNLPSEYSRAVSDKQSASEDISLAINQRQQALTVAETELQSAIEEAKRINDTAQNEADILIEQARIEAEGISVDFEADTAVYSSLKENLNLTTEGLLSFVASDVIAATDEPQVRLSEPALTTYREEL